MNYRKNLFLILVSIILLVPSAIHADSTSTPGGQDIQTTVKAKVVEAGNEESEVIPGTTTSENHQSITADILEGSDNGQQVTFDNDNITLSSGEVFYLTETISGTDGSVNYEVSDPYRLNSVYFFIGLFILLVIIFGGRQGIRGLFSLALSLLLIVYVFLPAILHGFSPILMSIVVASLIIILGSYITHGFKRATTAAVIGMIVTVILTGILAHFAVTSAHLSGFGSEEASELNFQTSGHLDFVGILLGGMLIGLLGVLYDAAISQAIAVEELHHVAPHLSRWKIYKRAIRIGKEHIGALVNTLAIAYVGVSLPLLLLFYTSGVAFLQVVNKELFATEILRTMIGSIGLVLAVPITTLLSSYILIRKNHGKTDSHEIKEEEEKIEHFEHRH